METDKSEEAEAPVSTITGSNNEETGSLGMIRHSGGLSCEAAEGQDRNLRRNGRGRSSGDTVQKKRKLHRCLNELQQYLSSMDQQPSSQSSTPSDSDKRKNSIASVGAVRQALKLLKWYSQKETKQERLQSRRETGQKPGTSGDVHYTMAVDTVHNSLTSSSLARCWSSEIAADKCDDIVNNHQDSMRFVVSCGDGLLLEASDNAYSALQLSPTCSPLPGRMFVSLFSPNDQALLVAFMLNAQLAFNSSPPTSSHSSNFASSGPLSTKEPAKPLFRFYASLRCGLQTSSQSDQNPKYLHCRVVCRVKNNDDEQATDSAPVQPVLLSMTALPLPVLFASDRPAEPPQLAPFCTKHSPSCVFIHVDNECVNAWGYLPQELIGRSILSYVSKDSLKWLEAAHEQAVKAKGKPVRSKPYNFILRDGTLAAMQTEWSLFVNPWSRETEFVIGYHKVVERPKTARLFDEEPSEGSKVATKLDSREAKTQARIRRTLAKVHKQQYYKSQSNKPLTVGSSTTEKDISSGSANPNGSTDGQTNNSFAPSNLGSKSKGLNMGMYLDRMIETELFRNAETRKDEVALGACSFVVGEGSGDSEQVMPPVGHQDTSPISAGEAISSSPPESSGSGPTYKEINLKEKVARFLHSQTVIHSGSSRDGSSGEKSHSGYSPPCYNRMDSHAIDGESKTQLATAQEAVGGRSQPHSMEAIDLSAMAAASIMHRSRSAASDLNQYRHLTPSLEGEPWHVPLTPDVLRQFTKEKERESKADWKRRYSTADAPPQSMHQVHQHAAFDYATFDTKNPQQISPRSKQTAFDPGVEMCIDAPPLKIMRAAGDSIDYQKESRPSSMPVISRAQNSISLEHCLPLVKQAGSQWPYNGPLRNTTAYYRSLGPTPAPPPGKNFQISSAPLPAPPPSPPLDPFRCAGVDKGSYPQMNAPQSLYRHSAFAPPPPKPPFIGEMGQPAPSGHHSVIQASPMSPFSPRASHGHWFNAPGTSASAILQRMVPMALAREQAEAAASAYWPQPNQAPLPAESAQASLDAYGRRYEGAAGSRDVRPYMDYSTPSGTASVVIYPKENLYNEFSLNSETMAQQKPNDEV